MDKTEYLKFTEWFLQTNCNKFDPKNLAESIVDEYFKYSERSDEARTLVLNEDDKKLILFLDWYMESGITNRCLNKSDQFVKLYKKELRKSSDPSMGH